LEFISGLNLRHDFCFEIKLLNVFRLGCLFNTCTLNGCKCAWVVGMLCVSIVLLDLLSFSLISCVHHRNLVGRVFFYLLLTSVTVCVNVIWVMWPLLQSCHYAQCIRCIFSCNRSLIFNQKTLGFANRRPIYFYYFRRSSIRQKRKPWLFLKIFNLNSYCIRIGFSPL